jgi:hypothetical protein
VDVSSGRDHLDSLTAEEAIEQVRDWALLGAYSLSAPAGAAHREALISLVPVRVDALASLYFRRAGVTRSVTLSDGRFLVLVPEAPEGTRRELQVGRLLDEERAAKGRIPAIVTLFEYRIEQDNGAAQIREVVETPGQAFFREEDGYYERPIAALADLDAFLTLNLDITHSRLDNGRLILGGRKVGDGMPQLITREDLAALKQAGVHIADDVREQLRKRGLRAEYDRRVREAASEALAKRDTTDGVAPYADMLSLIRYIEAENPYDKFEALQIEAILEDNPPSLGFSLDPRVNRTGIAADIESALRGDPALYDGWFLEQVTTAVAQQLALADDEPDMETRLSQLRAGSDKPVPAGEASLRTLVGLEPPPMRISKSSAADDLSLSSMFRRPDNATIVKGIIEHTKEVVRARAEELQRVAASLRQGSTDALLDLQRYLNADAIGLTMRPGAAAYRVRDLQQMLHDITDDALPVDGVYGAKTTATVRQFQESLNLKPTGIVDEDTWEALLSGHGDKSDELNELRQLLNKIETKNNYQCGRYDGRLAGTRVGMTLFYTDLLMKLWSFADGKEAPPVPGFVSETQFEVSPVYWDNERRFSSTRGWLGPRLEGFKVRESTSVSFAPVATRLYNASSNPLINGKEVPATFAPERFSAWWNAHYLDVADYEPQYHRLNQIMKWVVVLTAYDEVEVPVLSSLTTVPVARNLRFDSWWDANRDGLRVAPVDAFRRVDTETTECIDILRSKAFRAMGSIYRMSGGVTLPGKLTIKAKAAANEARADVPELLKAAGFDVPGATVSPKSIRLPITEGGVARGTLDLPRGLQTAEFRAAAGRPLEGTGGTLSTEQIRFAFNGVENGGIQVRGSAGAASVFDLSMVKAANGKGLRLNYADGDLFRSVRELKKFERSGAALDPGDHLWIPDTHQLLVRASGNRWTVIAADALGKSELKKASSSSAVLDKATTEPVLRFAVADAPATARLLSNAEMASLTERLHVEKLSPTSAFEPTATLRAELVTAFPADAAEVTFRIGATELRGRFDDVDLYLPRSADVGQNARVVSEAVSSDDFGLLLTYLKGQPAGAAAATRGKNGQLVVASMGSGFDVNPQEMRALAEVLPANVKGQRLFLRADNQPGVFVNEFGSLEVPRALGADDVAVATRAAQFMNGDASFGEALGRVGPLDMATLETLAKIPGVQRAAYVEFRSAPSLLRGEALVDLRVTADSTNVMIRRDAHVEFLPLRAVSPKQLAEEYQYVDDVMNPARAEREGRAVVDPTMDEFLKRTRGIFEHLREIASATKGERILTKESRDVSNATLWALHKGDARVRIFRDQPDMRASLQNARQAVTVAPGRSVFAITADPGGAEGMGNVPALTARVGRRVPISAATSFESFMTILRDPNVSQIVLVAREQDGGLVFADRWVSLMAIEAMLGRAPKKPMLVVVSNGGVELQKAFSDSGRFSRVLSLKYVLGQLDTFEAALESVARLLETTTDATTLVAKEEFDATVGAAGPFADALVAASRVDGAGVHVDLDKLLTEARRVPADLPTLIAVQSLLMANARSAKSADVDGAVERMASERLARKAPNTARKARTELSALVQTKYE